LQTCLPEYRALHGVEYSNLHHGYCVSWLCLDPIERESAEAYMLGRVLWCIFEGLSSPEIVVWQCYLHELNIEFPSYHRMPLRRRHSIDNCTQARGWESLGVVRRGNSLVLRDVDGLGAKEQVQAVATTESRAMETPTQLAPLSLPRRKSPTVILPLQRLRYRVMLVRTASLLVLTVQMLVGSLPSVLNLENLIPRAKTRT